MPSSPKSVQDWISSSHLYEENLFFYFLINLILNFFIDSRICTPFIYENTLNVIYLIRRSKFHFFSLLE
mgnify:CR=1 FL=1